MGSVIATSGTRRKRYALRNARNLMHQPLIGGVLEGQATDLEIEAREMLRVRDRLYQLYADATGQAIDRTPATATATKRLDDQEMVEYGLVDKVLTSMPPTATGAAISTATARSEQPRTKGCIPRRVAIGEVAVSGLVPVPGGSMNSRPCKWQPKLSTKGLKSGSFSIRRGILGTRSGCCPVFSFSSQGLTQISILDPLDPSFSDPLSFDPLVPWSLVPMVPWSLGPLVPWSLFEGSLGNTIPNPRMRWQSQRLNALDLKSYSRPIRFRVRRVGVRIPDSPFFCWIEIAKIRIPLPHASGLGARHPAQELSDEPELGGVRRYFRAPQGRERRRRA